jgi:hypothetical protein
VGFVLLDLLAIVLSAILRYISVVTRGLTKKICNVSWLHLVPYWEDSWLTNICVCVCIVVSDTGFVLLDLLAIVLSAILRYTDSDYPFGILDIRILITPSDNTMAKRSSNTNPTKNWS